MFPYHIGKKFHYQIITEPECTAAQYTNLLENILKHKASILFQFCIGVPFLQKKYKGQIFSSLK